MTFDTLFKIIASILLTGLLTSCSDEKNNQKTAQKSEKTSQIKIETAEKRALARWNALIEKDWTAAYSYESPNYRKNYAKRDFINSFGQAVSWVGIKHLATTPINKTLADVKLELLFTYDMSGNLIKIPSNITERWQLIDNKWWHIKK